MKNHYFFSQPHQPLFLLAFFNAVVLMLLFMLGYKGVIVFSGDIINFHSYGLIYLLFTPAFLAFLFTTFPKFLATPVVKKSLYLKIFTLFLLGDISFVFGALFSFTIYKVGMFITLIAMIYSVKILFDIFKKSSYTDKYDTFWILVGLSFGLTANILFLVLSSDVLAIQISIYLYLFIVTFSVAQRMIPFFSQCRLVKDRNFLKYVSILLALHVVLEYISTNLSFIADILLAILIGKELYRWKLPFPNTNPMLWILHISLFWIPIAFFISSISGFLSYFYGFDFLALGIHTLMLGFLLTVLIGFGTRVTLGHSGNMIHANKLTTYIFYLTQVVVILRILVSIVASFGMDYMILFDISITFWLLLFLVWSWQFLKVLVLGKKLPQRFTA